jgi:hypothetical protein
MAISNIVIDTMGTYSTVGSSIALTPDVSYVTFTITVFVGVSEKGTSGTLTFSGMPAGVSVVGHNPAKLIANDMQPYANVTFKVASNATTLDFSVTPKLDDKATAAPKPYSQSIVWLEAGVLFPSFTTNSQPGDLPALDTSGDHMQSATIKANVTDSSQAPVQGMTLRFGAAHGETINGYKYEDLLTGNSLNIIKNGIPSTAGDAVEVTTDASGQAGFKISIPDDSLAAQAQIVSWGVQLLGIDSTFFRGTDPLFIGPMQGLPQLGSPAAPNLEDADESSNYDPGTPTTLMDMVAWKDANPSDNVLVIVGDDNPRPRQLLKVHECAGGDGDISEGDKLVYTLNTDRLVTGDCPLRFLAFKSGLSSVSYSYTNDYQVGALPPEQPPTVNRTLPVPRLFVKEVDDLADPVLGMELESGTTVNWDDIKFGGVYVFIPYAANSGTNGNSWLASVKIYRTGIYQGQNNSSTVPKQYPAVSVNNTEPTPSGAGAPLPNGTLMLIPIEDLRNWNAPKGGFPGAFQVEYWESSSKYYSVIWKGYIDTVPIGK